MYSIDQVKRLVPEATDIERFRDGSVTIEIEGLYINTDERWARLLLTTRRQLAIARAALEKIVQWGPFPDTGKAWPDGEPMSYGAAFGSNGERDFMRNTAKEALDAFKKEGEA